MRQAPHFPGAAVEPPPIPSREAVAGDLRLLGSRAIAFGSRATTISKDPGAGTRDAGLGFEVRCRASSRRPAAADTDGLRVVAADEVLLLMAAATSYDGFDNVARGRYRDSGPIAAARSTPRPATPWETSSRAHVSDHAAIMSRVTLDLGASSVTSRQRRPTSASRRPGAGDPQLVALLFAVRALPADRAAPGPARSPRTCRASGTTGAPAVELELHDEHQRADELLAGRVGQPRRDARAAARHDRRPRGRPARRPPGPTTARAAGCAHHNSDLWRQSAPGRRLRRRRSGLGVWPMAAPWLAQHLWEHYAFGGDREFLRDARLPADEGRRRVLPRLAGRRREGPSGDGAVDVARAQVRARRRQAGGVSAMACLDGSGAHLGSVHATCIDGRRRR